MVGVFTVGKQNKNKKASWTLRSSILSLLEDCDPERDFPGQKLSRKGRKEGWPLPILDTALGRKLISGQIVERL